MSEQEKNSNDIEEVFTEEVQQTSNTDLIPWVPQNKRLGAFVIDLVIAMILASILGWIGALLAGAYMLFRDGLNLEFMNNRSLGKKLLKLKVETTDGSPIDYMTSVRRNWPFALAYIPTIFSGFGGFLGFAGFVLLLVEGFKVITGNQRIGDGMANTYVTEE